MAQLRHRSLCFGKFSSVTGAGCHHAVRNEKFWLFAHGRVCPRKRLVRTTCKEVRRRNDGLHGEHLWVLRAQTHGSAGALDGCLRLAQVDLYPASGKPSPGQVLIEREGAIDESRPIIELA